MSRQTRAFWAVVLSVVTFAAGCKPVQPFYLGEHDDMAHYIGVATDLEYPDANVESLTETTMAEEPFSLSNPEPKELWDLTLEEAVQISLHNSKVLKQIGGGVSSTSFSNASLTAGVFLAPPPSGLRQLATTPDGVSTVYNPALQETNVASTATQGVESALSAFDAQWNTSLFWDRTDRPQNVTPSIFFPGVSQQDTMTFQSEITKQSASGAQFAFRNNTTYNETNSPNAALNHDWLTNFEAEWRQPLMRGAGTQVNRVPVVLARIRTDISLADFECNVRNHVFDTEKAYWELYFAYRNLESLKEQRDSVHALWRNIAAQVPLTKPEREEAQARQEYFRARGRVEGALLDVFKAENRLRFMLGLAPTDGRLIRPVDEPLNARVCFDWHEILAEALCRSCEIRIKRWQIKQRETELLQARNQLLPQFDAVALYRWLGRGEELRAGGTNAPAYPLPGSDAFEELFGGNYQEWRLGFQTTLPIGFRRELAGVRNAQLQLARECAILKETELELAHQMTDAVQNADGWYELAETNFNRRVAAEAEVATLLELFKSGSGEGSTVLNLLLDALTRRADAQALFYRSLVNYTSSVTEIHYHKGSLLEHDNVLLAEGAWPDKAYFDAHHQARKRSAGHYLNYGYTRPGVISRGPYEQFQHGLPPGEGVLQGADGPSMHDAVPLGPVEVIQSSSAPSGDRVTQNAADSGLQLATAIEPIASAPASVAPTPSAATAPLRPVQQTQGAVELKVKNDKFDWGTLATPGAGAASRD